MNLISLEATSLRSPFWKEGKEKQNITIVFINFVNKPYSANSGFYHVESKEYKPRLLHYHLSKVRSS